MCFFETHPSNSQGWVVDSTGLYSHEEWRDRLRGNGHEKLREDEGSSTDNKTAYHFDDSPTSEHLGEEETYLYQVDNSLYHIRHSTTSSTSATEPQVARLRSPFFINFVSGICMSFNYLIHAAAGPNSASLSAYLLPCNTAYEIPVMTMTSSPNDTTMWQKCVIPLPDYRHPYQVVLESRLPNHPAAIAVDNVVFSDCGKLITNAATVVLLPSSE